MICCVNSAEGGCTDMCKKAGGFTLSQQDFVIITDVTTDFTPDMAKKLGVDILPMEFMIDGVSYFHYPDGREMSMNAFYEQIKAGKMPTTTQINQTEYQKRFAPILEEGKDILYICFSSGLSSTWQSSCLAARELEEEFPGRRVCSVDSRCASAGEGLLVLYAVRMKEQGASMDEIAKWIEENRDKVCHWVLVDDLKHLHRGGRLPAVAAVAGIALGIKPIIHVTEEGKLEAIGKVRGRKKGVDYLLKKIEETCPNPQESIIWVVHTDCEPEAKDFCKTIKSMYHPKELYLSEIGPIIGAHTGPNVLAVVFLGTHK